MPSPEKPKISERELTDKLIHVSEAEMESFHKIRMKKYRKFFYIAIGCGVVGTIFYFVLPTVKWVSAIFSGTGFFILVLGAFQREKWKRLYARLVFMKKSREKTLEKQKNIHNPYDNKFSKK
jgi:hypothetical protein